MVSFNSMLPTPSLLKNISFLPNVKSPGPKNQPHYCCILYLWYLNEETQQFKWLKKRLHDRQSTISQTTQPDQYLQSKKFQHNLSEAFNNLTWQINISSGHCNSILTGVAVWHCASKSIKPNSQIITVFFSAYLIFFFIYFWHSFILNIFRNS